jgi:hypothetical protein
MQPGDGAGLCPNAWRGSVIAAESEEHLCKWAVYSRSADKKQTAK